MVAEEANGLKKEILHARGGDSVKSLFDRGSEPWTTAGTLALESKPPLRNLGHESGDQFGGTTSILGIWIDALPWPKAWLANPSFA